MNDFLGRLVQRALAPEPAVRPRLASLYEPSAQGVLSAFAETVSPPQKENHRAPDAEADRATTAPNRVKQPSLVKPATRSPVPSPQTNGPQAADALTSDALLTNDASLGTEPANPISAQASPGAPRRPFAASPPPEAFVPAREPRVTEQEPGVKQAPPATPLDVPRANPSSVPALELLVDVPDEPVQTIVTSEAARTRPSQSEPNAAHPLRRSSDSRVFKPGVKARPSQPVPNGPHPLPRRSGSQVLRPAVKASRVAHNTPDDFNQDHGGAVTDAANLPDVHITIGRVEIRAATPAPASRVKSNPAPRLSLDDYLKRSAGGAR